jgi:hypothetical protein
VREPEVAEAVTELVAEVTPEAKLQAPPAVTLTSVLAWIGALVSWLTSFPAETVTPPADDEISPSKTAFAESISMSSTAVTGPVERKSPPGADKETLPEVLLTTLDTVKPLEERMAIDSSATASTGPESWFPTSTRLIARAEIERISWIESALPAYWSRLPVVVMRRSPWVLMEARVREAFPILCCVMVMSFTFRDIP